MPDLIPMRQRIQALLDAPFDSSVLNTELQALATEDSESFEAAADLWAPALVKHGVDTFSHLLQQHLKRPDVILPLLPEIVKSSNRWLFPYLYRRAATPERFNADIMAVAQMRQSDKALAEALASYGRSYYYASTPEPDLWLTDETATALYARDHKIGHNFLIYNIAPGTGGYPMLREAFRHKTPRENFWALFRRVANEPMWLAELQALLKAKTSADKIAAELTARTPEVHVEMPHDLVDTLLARYADTVQPYLEGNVFWYLRRQIKAALDADLSDSALLERMSELANRNNSQFNHAADLWFAPLYARDQYVFESFMRNHVRREQAAAFEPLLSQIEMDERDVFFRELYSYIADEKRWNADILAVAQSDVSDQAVLRAIERRDRSGNLRMVVPTALALYRRNPLLFGEFVRDRTQRDSDLANTLGAEAQARGDMATYWALFREWADNSMWQAEMRALLARDLPADQIVAELELRHPNDTKGIQPGILREFYVHYGDAILPYLEKHFNTITRERLDSLLALPIDRAALLRELEKLSRYQRHAFRELAGVWAPVLYTRDPQFFEGFLVRNLDRWTDDKAIRALLPQVEAGEHESLFKTLYRKETNNERWNSDMKRLAASDLPDEAVLKAIERRSGQSWFTLNEDAAITLYQRNAELFRDFLRRIVRPSWRNSEGSYSRLRAVVKARGDDAFYWELFRSMATTKEWQESVNDLLNRKLNADQIGAELAKRQLTRLGEINGGVLFEILKKYGIGVLPSLEPYMGRIVQWNRGKTRDLIKRLDEASYRRLFFTLNRQEEWDAEIAALATRRLSDGELWAELQTLSPDSAQWSFASWRLTTDTALALYKRAPAVARPFLERYLGQQPDTRLFDAANQQGDEEFLDLLTFGALNHLDGLVNRAYPRASYGYYQKADANARIEIESLGGVVTQRFDRLVAISPETYVRHAANILARFRAFARLNYTRNAVYNPAFAYLITQHHDAWLNSPEGIRELLESPNIHVQLIALDMLAQASSREGAGSQPHILGSPAPLGEGFREGAAAAKRVLESLPMLRALLLSGTRRATKKLVLRCLQSALQHGPEFAEPILSVIEDTMDFRGRRGIDKQLLVAYVRTRALQKTARERV